MCVPGKTPPNKKPSSDKTAAKPPPETTQPAAVRVTRHTSPQRTRGPHKVSTATVAETKQDEMDRKRPAVTTVKPSPAARAGAPDLLDTDSDNSSDTGESAPAPASRGRKNPPPAHGAVVIPAATVAAKPTKTKRANKRCAGTSNAKKARKGVGRGATSPGDDASAGGSSASLPIKHVVLKLGSPGTRGQIFGQKMRPTGSPHLVNYLVTRNRIVMLWLSKANSKEPPYTGALQNALTSNFAAETLAKLQVNMVATRRLSEKEDKPILHQLKRTEIEHRCYLKSVSREDEPSIMDIAAAAAKHVAKICEQYSMQDQWSSKFEVGENLTPKNPRPVACYVMNTYCAAILVDVYDRVPIAKLLQNVPLVKDFFGRRNYNAGLEILESSVDLLYEDAVESDGSDSDDYGSDHEAFFARQGATQTGGDNGDTPANDDGDNSAASP